MAGLFFFLKAGERRSCGVYWAAVEATCRADVLAEYLNADGGGRAAMLHILLLGKHISFH